MKTSHYIFTALGILFLSSCDAATKEVKNTTLSTTMAIAEQNPTIRTPRPFKSTQDVKQSNTQGKKQFPLKDPQGQVMGSFPIPQNWNESKEQNIFLESNDGVKVMDYVVNEFNYSPIQDFNQMLRETGQQIKRVKSLERLVQEDLVPLAQAEGIKLLSFNKTPVLTNAFAKRAQQFNAQGQQSRYDSAIVEFVDQNGAPSFAVIKYYINTGQNSQQWGYQLTGVEAPKAIYEQTKKDYLYALINAKLDPQYVQRANTMSQQQAASDYAAHQTRMKGIRATSENNTRLFNERSAISDAQHESWRSQQQSSDRMQQQTINTIREVNTYTDGSGNNYEIPGYSKYVFMNANGQYITSEDPSYDPNRDENAPGSWKKLKPQRKEGGY